MPSHRANAFDSLPRLKGRTRASQAAPASSTHTAEKLLKCRRQVQRTARAAKRTPSLPELGTWAAKGAFQSERGELVRTRGQLYLLRFCEACRRIGVQIDSQRRNCNSRGRLSLFGTLRLSKTPTALRVPWGPLAGTLSLRLHHPALSLSHIVELVNTFQLN